MLSIIIPVLNEERNLKKLIPLIYLNFKKNFEIIIVDDNSKDNTPKLIKILKKKYKNIRLIIRKNKIKDLSLSCKIGFSRAKYNLILVMDGDGQHDVKNINKILTLHQKNDVTVGCRKFNSKQLKMGSLRKIFSLILIFLINKFLGRKVSDPMSGFFIFNKKIYLQNKKFFYFHGFKILLNFLYRTKNLKINECKINFLKRNNLKSKMNLKVLYYIIMFSILTFFNKKFNEN